MKQKKTLAEELAQYRGWLYERNLTVGDVVRRVVAVAVAMLGGALTLLAWALALETVGEYFRTGYWGWIVGGLGLSGAALLVTCGVSWLVWAIWTNEL